jgi:hypothetical protein
MALIVFILYKKNIYKSNIFKIWKKKKKNKKKNFLALRSLRCEARENKCNNVSWNGLCDDVHRFIRFCSLKSMAGFPYR